jgi:hypothetical protein
MKPGFVDVGDVVSAAQDADQALSFVSSALLGAKHWMRGDEGDLATALLDGIKRFREAQYARESTGPTDQ